jgi:hypothetical protein
MHGLTFDPGQRRVLLLVSNKTFLSRLHYNWSNFSLPKCDWANLSIHWCFFDIFKGGIEMDMPGISLAMGI